MDDDFIFFLVVLFLEHFFEAVFVYYNLFDYNVSCLSFECFSELLPGSLFALSFDRLNYEELLPEVTLNIIDQFLYFLSQFLALFPSSSNNASDANLYLLVKLNKLKVSMSNTITSPRDTNSAIMCATTIVGSTHFLMNFKPSLPYLTLTINRYPHLI
jgi:hypothetical protein